IFKPPLRAGSERGDEPMLRARKLCADVLQKKASGAVGVLGFAFLPAQLAKERSLLIAGDSGDGNTTQAKRSRHLAHAFAGPYDLRQHALRNTEEIEQLVVPCALHDIEE